MIAIPSRVLAALLALACATVLLVGACGLAAPA